MDKQGSNSATPWFREITLDTATELLHELSPRSERFLANHRHEWAFRGQADHQWGLKPSAFRSDCKLLLGGVSEPYEKWRNLIQMTVEGATLDRFVRDSDRAGLVLPGDLNEIRNELQKPHLARDRRGPGFVWPSPKIWPVVALAQHYGISTRFLDWTWSAHVACYFAAVDSFERNPTGRLAIWACWIPAATGDARPECSNKSIRQATAPYGGNPNLCAQEGIHIMIEVLDPDMEAPADRDDLRDLFGGVIRYLARPAVLKLLCRAIRRRSFCGTSRRKASPPRDYSPVTRGVPRLL